MLTDLQALGSLADFRHTFSFLLALVLAIYSAGLAEVLASTKI